jgi:flagellar FliJ protein
VAFQYPFQKVVDLKSSEKTYAERILSKAIGELHTEQSRLDTLQSHREQVQSQVAASVQETTTVSHLRLMQQYMNHIDRQIDRKHKDVQDAQYTVFERQDQLTMKMREEKQWVKAREKAYRKFETDVRRKEQYEMDEMASLRSRLIES